MNNLPRYWPDNVYDIMTMEIAKEELKQHHPRVMYVGLGETDEWAHARRYDLYLNSAHNGDRFIAELWNEAQKLPQYAGKTRCWSFAIMVVGQTRLIGLTTAKTRPARNISGWQRWGRGYLHSACVKRSTSSKSNSPPPSPMYWEKISRKAAPKQPSQLTSCQIEMIIGPKCVQLFAPTERSILARPGRAWKMEGQY